MALFILHSIFSPLLLYISPGADGSQADIQLPVLQDNHDLPLSVIITHFGKYSKAI